MAGTTTQQGSVAVVGTGAIGSAVALRLLATGHDVTVWNRTPRRLEPLLEAGARSAASVEEAVSTSALTLVAMTDYEAVRECLGQVSGPLPDSTVVVLCTGTADDAAQAAGMVETLGASYLDAGVQSPPEAITAGDGVLVYGGSRTAFDRHAPVLGVLGRPRFVGTSPEASSVWDLALFGVWYDAQLGLLRALDAARGAGIDLDEFADTARTQLGHVVAGVPDTVVELTTNVFPPGPASLAEHLRVLRHLIALREGGVLGDGGLDTVVTRLEALLAQGRGAEGLTAVAAVAAVPDPEPG